MDFLNVKRNFKLGVVFDQFGSREKMSVSA